MPLARHLSIIAICLLLGACASAAAGSAAKNGVLLRAADLPDMRIRNESPTLAPADFEEAVGHGILFKDPVAKVIGELKSFGFKRAYAEQFAGAGTTAGAFVAEFDGSKDLKGMLEYMNGNLFEECPGDPTCSRKSVLSVPSIPGSDGEVVHPNRGPTDGGDITLYKVIFRIGSAIYGMEIGGDEVYDPGTVSRSTALAAFKAFYERVKSESIDQIFTKVPKEGLGPPPPGAPPGPLASVSGTPS